MSQQHVEQTAARVLLVEDEMLPSMVMEDALTELGCCVRKAARLPKALQLAISEKFTFAVLDVNLDGERVFPVAAALRERKVPFLFSSGYGDSSIPPEYRDCKVLQKPYGMESFRQAVQVLLGR
ncbi:MAG: response regulator [Rhodanobacteraceae bacterium]